MGADDAADILELLRSSSKSKRHKSDHDGTDGSYSSMSDSHASEAESEVADEPRAESEQQESATVAPKQQPMVPARGTSPARQTESTPAVVTPSATDEPEPVFDADPNTPVPVRDNSSGGSSDSSDTPIALDEQHRISHFSPTRGNGVEALLEFACSPRTSRPSTVSLLDSSMQVKLAQTKLRLLGVETERDALKKKLLAKESECSRLRAELQTVQVVPARCAGPCATEARFEPTAEEAATGGEPTAV